MAQNRQCKTRSSLGEGQELENLEAQSKWELAWRDPHHSAGRRGLTLHVSGGCLSRNSPHESWPGQIRIIWQDDILSHCICQEEACPDILHANLKYNPYKMQVVQRSSDTDNIIAQMHHLDLVICNGHQGHVTLTATHFFQNYLGNVCTTSSHHRRAVNTRLLHYSQCSSEDIHGYLYIETTAVNCQEAFTYGGCNF